MGLRRIAFLLCVTLISGCASAGQHRVTRRLNDDAPRTLTEIYQQSGEGRISVPQGKVQLLPEAGDVKPYWPVYEPPRIIKVWVPAHVDDNDKDIMVAGHWVFVMVDAPQWYIQRYGRENAGGHAVLPVLPRKEK